MRLKGFLAIGFAIGLTGCDADILGLSNDDSPSRKAFPEPTGSCATAAIPGEYLVKWKSGKITKEVGSSVDDFRKGFVTQHLDQIELVEQNREISIRPFLNPDSSRIAIPRSEQPATIDNWQIENANVQELWAMGHRGEGVVIAVIDSEADIEHDQLEGRIAENLGEVGLDAEGNDKAFNGIDDDENGYVDDAYGYNFVNEQGLPSSPSSHGTHVAGIIAAEHKDTETGFRSYTQGVAPDARIIPLAFISRTSGSLNDAIRAMDYAKQRQVDIVNASWGAEGICSTLMKEKIDELGEAGILFVAAAGNESADVDVIDYSPAGFNLARQITVGATGRFDFTTSFSNIGRNSVHLFAPGDEITSTVPCESEGCENSGDYSRQSGTSMAAPMVAGAAALLISAVPSSTPDQIKKALMEGSDFSQNYWNASQGKLNARKALEALEK